MKRYLRTIACLLLVACFSLETLQSQQKSKFDVSDLRLSKSALETTTMSVPGPGWRINQTFSEVTVVPGCFYTIGTRQGLSGSKLDSATSITYGHPYARTSYPLMHIDGAWGRPEDLFPGEQATVQVAAESIAVSYLTASHLRATFCILLSNEGKQITLTARLANEDTLAHTLGCGFAFDPALGNRGDGGFSIDGKVFSRDTLIEEGGLQGSTWLVTERPAGRKGMKIAFQFPSGAPARCLAANWHDLLGSDTTAPSYPAVRAIYDLMLKFYWSPVSVPPGSNVSNKLEVDLLPPDFGDGVFMRWDLPGFISLDDGVVFPRDFTSWVALANRSPVTMSGLSVQIIPSFPVQSSVDTRYADISGDGFQYVSFPLMVKEIYENQVVNVAVLCRAGGSVVDSLVRPFFIPATPVSDTGLTVTIDSIVTSGLPQVGVVFEAKRSATLQKVYGISAENVFLYDNGTRISEFTLGKEVGSGIGEADIVFVLDVTGSMENEIAAVKNNIIEFTDSLVEAGVNFRLGMVTFLDAIENVYDFTSDPQQFKNTVGLQYAHGGGDSPENSLDALYEASQLQFREGANRIFIWITDESFHESDWATTRTRQEVLDRLLLMDITVSAIGSPAYQTDFYNPIVEPTGGQFYDIDGNFRDILLDIGRLQSISKYRVTYISPAGEPGQREVSLTIHLAGLGGTASASYATMGGSGSASLACYPNPFNPLLKIRVNVGRTDHGTVTLYDILGRRVREFTVQGAGGNGEIVWDARNEAGQEVGTGIYFVRLALFGPDNRARGSSLAKVLHLK